MIKVFEHLRFKHSALIPSPFSEKKNTFNEKPLKINIFLLLPKGNIPRGKK